MRQRGLGTYLRSWRREANAEGLEEELRQDIDATPLLRGLPGDRCQCPHWGYVIKGKMTMRFADHEETYEAGEAYYVPPGHTPIRHEPGTEVVQFSPAEELRPIEAVMIKNRAEPSSSHHRAAQARATRRFARVLRRLERDVVPEPLRLLVRVGVASDVDQERAVYTATRSWSSSPKSSAMRSAMRHWRSTCSIGWRGSSAATSAMLLCASFDAPRRSGRVV